MQQHKAYPPLRPTANRLLQHAWDTRDYQRHRHRVRVALPVVDTKGSKTPTHIQLQLKKLQLQDERRSAVERDNLLLASGLARIRASPARVDHQNRDRHLQQLASASAAKRRAELAEVSRQNQKIHQRITSRRSEYRRQLWLADWQKAEQLSRYASHYPRLPDACKQVTENNPVDKRRK